MENPGTIKLKDLISNRVSMYIFLARIYRVEVDQELLDQMIKMDLSLEVEVPEINEGYRILKGFLENLRDNTLTDLAVDYARILLGAGLAGAEGAYPYESVYTSPKRLLMQDARDQVLKIYREEGLDRVKEFKEPEDHIAIELEFMAYLCEKTTEALDDRNKGGAQSYLKKQRDFLEKHLLTWAPAFCSDIERCAREDFYKAVAMITTGYLDLEKELIGQIIDEISVES
jgi:TorA maturation chaperone TorD